MAVYDLQETGRSWIVRDFPGAPNNNLRVAPEVARWGGKLSGLGCYSGGATMPQNVMWNQPCSNLQPPGIETLMLPSGAVVPTMPAIAAVNGGSGASAGFLIGGIAVALFLLSGKTSRQNPMRRRRR